MNLRYLLYFLVTMAISANQGRAQEKHSVLIKVFDEQLKPVPNIQISLNGKEHTSVGKSGSSFIELVTADLPPQSVSIKNDQLEAASWNYSKGVLQIIVRKKSYEIVAFTLTDTGNKPITDVEITFKGKTDVTTHTNSDGQFEIPLSLDDVSLSTQQFVVANHAVIKVVRSKEKSMVIAEPVKPDNQSTPVADRPAPVKEDPFKDFDLSQLDSIQSLTVFYAVFKNYHVNELDDDVKRKLDEKLRSLVEALNDSVAIPARIPFIGRISDSSFVSDDIKNLLSQAAMENHALDENRDNFDDKITMIRQKLASGIGDLDPETRQNLLTDLRRLEQILEENENKFFKNQSHYRLILNAINENFFHLEDLEDKLSFVEAQRLKEQEVFRKRLLTISLIVAFFAILIVLLILVRNKLKTQKKELVIANSEIKRINENLEDLVSKRTRLLQEANRELDLFLYKASHDLRSPLRSIIGLGNLAASDPAGVDANDLFKKVMHTAYSMDRLLNKLRIISEINQPGKLTAVEIFPLVQEIANHFTAFIEENEIDFRIDCPKDLQLYSNKTLMEAILFYLLENALFFCTLREQKTPGVQLVARTADEYVEFTVHDNGIGVAKDIQTKIFDMFYIGHERSAGNGLGLYIVDKSVHALNGAITIESEVNQYTRFVVRIPIQVPNQDVAKAPYGTAVGAHA